MCTGRLSQCLIRKEVERDVWEHLGRGLTAKAKKARRSEAEVAEDEIATASMGDYCSVTQL